MSKSKKDSSSEIKDLKAKKDKLDLQKQVVEAEVALVAEQNKKLVAEAEAATAVASAELKRKQDVAEAEKKLTETNKANLQAKLPKSTVTKLSGSITTDENFGYVAEVAAYKAMFRNIDKLASKIIDDVTITDETRVLIVNELQVAGGDTVRLQLDKSMELWGSLLENQKTGNNERREDIKKLLLADVASLDARSIPMFDAPVKNLLGQISNVPDIAESLIGSVASLSGFFQSKYTVSGQEIDITREAIVNDLAGKIKKLHPVILDFYLLDSSHVLESFSSLLDKREALSRSQVKLKIEAIDVLELKIKEDTANLPAASDNEKEQKILENKLKELQSKKDKLEEAKAEDKITTSLISEFYKFTENITKTEEGEGFSALAKAAQRELINSGKFTHLLWIKSVSSGGEAITVKKLWSSGLVSYIGGGVVSYVLAKTDGTIVSSGNTLGLSQVSHTLASNKDYQLKHVKMDCEYTKKCLKTIRGWFNCEWK